VLFITLLKITMNLTGVTTALVFTAVGEKQHGSVGKSRALLLSSLYYMKFVVNERHTLVG